VWLGLPGEEKIPLFYDVRSPRGDKKTLFFTVRSPRGDLTFGTIKKIGKLRKNAKTLFFR
jgi:hypothetical protein